MKARGAELPPALSGALLLAAVRLSDEMAEAVRPNRLTVDASGNLALGPVRGGESESYVAPELRNGAALPRDPRVLVYAAGALGYELLTLQPFTDANGPELKGPLASIIRKAMAKDRKRRFRNLDEMALAIEEVQARPTDEEERLILAAVAATGSGPPPRRVPLASIEVVPAAGGVEAPRSSEPPIPARSWDPVEEPPPAIEAFEAPLSDPGLVELHEAQARDAHRATIPGVEEMPVVRVPQPSEVPWTGDDPGAFTGDVRELRSLIEAEGRTRHEDLAVLDARVEALARVGARLVSLEERLSAPPPPPAPTRSALWLTGLAGVLVGAAAMLFLAPWRGNLPGPVSEASAAQASPGPARLVSPPVVLSIPLPGQGEPAAREEPRPVDRAPRERSGPAHPRPAPAKIASSVDRSAAREHLARGDKALRAFNPGEAAAAFQRALELDPRLAAAHRGMGMAYVLQGRNGEAKAAYARYLQLAPDAPDREQIQRLLAR